MSTSSSAAQHLPSAAASPACPAHTFCLSSFGNRTELGEGGSPGSENSRPIQGPSGRVEDRVGKAHPSMCGLLNWSVQLMFGPLISYCRNCSLLLAINWRMRKWATWKKEWEWVSMKKNWCFSNCGAGEDSWESLGLQGDQTSQS